MAIAPNTTFTSGQIFTAAQANAFPRGVMALATSDTTYNITLSNTITTGMTATFTAAADRYYKVTYFEPLVSTPTASNSYVSVSIRVTNAAGTQRAFSYVQTNTGGGFYQMNVCTFISTFSAGSVTLVGVTSANSTSGGPVAERSATSLAYIVVEDIGGA